MDDFLIIISDSGSESGKADIKINIVNIYITYNINEVPCLEMRILDGGNEPYFHTDKKTFSPGKYIVVKSPDEKIILFNGIVTGLSVVYEGTHYLDIIAYGDAIKMTEGYNSQLFKPGVKDSEIIEAMMTASGLKAKKIAPSEIEHEQYFCYQQTPWRIMMARIIANGFVFSPAPGENSVVDLQSHKGSKKAVDLSGGEVASFSLNLDCTSHIKSIASQAWNTDKQAIDKGVGEQANYKSFTSVNKVLNIPEMTLLSNVSLPEKELKVGITAQNNYRLLDQYQGEISFLVHPESSLANIELLQQLTLSQAGKEFSGEYLVSAIRHRLVNKRWFMDVELGLSLNKTLLSKCATLPPLQPMIAKVLAFKAEKKTTLQRITVALPLLAEKTEVWARLLSPFASKKEGFFFPPNVDDEVVLAFIDGDCRFPVIVGSCHNKLNEPPLAYAKEQPLKGLYVLDKDSKPINIIVDKEKSSLALDMDKLGSISISKDMGIEVIKEKTSVVLAETLALKSSSDLTITCDKSINVKATSNVVVEGAATEIK